MTSIIIANYPTPKTPEEKRKRKKKRANLSRFEPGTSHLRVNDLEEVTKDRTSYMFGRSYSDLKHYIEGVIGTYQTLNVGNSVEKI